MTWLLATTFVCAALVLLAAARAQDAPPAGKGEDARTPVSQESAPTPTPEFGPNAYKDLDKPHLLAGSYYSVRGGLTATLMLNNKGPRPLEVRPTLFGLAGVRLDVLPVTVEANSFRMIDLREWVAFGGPSFDEGSIQLFHTGRDLVLGAQIYLVDEAHRLSFEEKLTEITDGGPSRLEGVWWSPHVGAEMRLVLSNTADTPLTATARLLGSKRGGANAATLDLGPHETRVLDMSRSFQLADVDAGGGGSRKLKRAGLGAVTVEHSGGGGPLLARAMVRDAEAGYSAAVQFSAPGKGQSSRLEGAGLRLRGAAGERLETIVIARNVGDTVATLSGRVPYTTAGGEVAFVGLPDTRLGPGEAKAVAVDRALMRGQLPADVTTAGLEFEYTSPPGSVVVAAQSVSADGDQVYRVPLWDPLAQRSPTGGYPWYFEGSSATTVYIKNITDREQEYTAQLIFEGGRYGLGLKTIKPHETVTVDVRALRDTQTPDADQRTIPLNVTRGQILWSLMLADDTAVEDIYARLALIGRSEQTDAAKGVSSNYACQNCCGDTFFDGFISPAAVLADTGDIAEYTAYQINSDCYGRLSMPYPVNASWSTNNTSVATVEEVNNRGRVTAHEPGEVDVKAKWNVWYYADDPCDPGGGVYMTVEGGMSGEPADETALLPPPGCSSCYPSRRENASTADMQVSPRVGKIQRQEPGESTFADISGTLYVLKGTTVTFKAVPQPESRPWPANRPVWSGTAGATGTGPTKQVTFDTRSNDANDFKTVTASSGTSVVTVNVVVYELTGVLTPETDFQGRSNTRFGIEEKVFLSFTAEPSVTAAQAGGLRWRIVTAGTGAGTLASAADGMGTYDAPEASKDVSLKLEVLDGPSKGSGPARDITIVEPSSGRMTRAPGTGIKHIENTWSAGFLGVFRIGPEDVSFWNLLFYEGAAPMVSSGWLSTFTDPHPPSEFAERIGSDNAVTQLDRVFSGAKHGPYGEGEWYWDIPWHVRTKNSTRDFVAATIRQRATSDSDGKAVMSKGGASVSRMPSDPTTDW